MEHFTTEELKNEWEMHWNMKPPERLGRKMLERSLSYKRHEAELGGLPGDAQTHLDHLVKNFKQNPKRFWYYSFSKNG